MASYHAKVRHVVPGLVGVFVVVLGLGLPSWLLFPGIFLVLYMATPSPTWEDESEAPAPRPSGARRPR
jgi:hypothetical protein